MYNTLLYEKNMVKELGIRDLNQNKSNVNCEHFEKTLYFHSISRCALLSEIETTQILQSRVP